MEQENELKNLIRETLGEETLVTSKEFVSCALLFILANIDSQGHAFNVKTGVPFSFREYLKYGFDLNVSDRRARSIVEELKQYPFLAKKKDGSYKEDVYNRLTWTVWFMVIGGLFEMSEKEDEVVYTITEKGASMGSAISKKLKNTQGVDNDSLKKRKSVI